MYKYPCPLATDHNTHISPLNRLLRISEMLGKLVHLGIDAMLISAFLAGIKRSTGLTCVSLPSLTPCSLLCPVSNCELTYPLASRDATECRPALTQVPNKDVRREWSPPRENLVFLKSLVLVADLLRTYLELGTLYL